MSLTSWGRLIVIVIYWTCSQFEKRNVWRPAVRQEEKALSSSPHVMLVLTCLAMVLCSHSSKLRSQH